MRLLMVAPDFPSPAGKGYQVRLYHEILGLAPRHEIALVAFGAEARITSELRDACRDVVGVPWSLRAGAVKALLAAPRLPLSVGLYRDRRMSAVLREHAMHAELVHVQMVRMAPYLDALRGQPVVLDLLDASELSMRERARAASRGPRELLMVEARRLGAYEKRVIATAAMSLLISERDFDFLGRPDRARVLPNGVDPQPHSGQRLPNTIVFSGTMSYFPNADAASWFAREILPEVRRAVPRAEFRIVGREPDARIRELAALPGVTVTGPVRDIAAEIASATVSVCPMRYGSGMQTKILEAMAVGTPVVATPTALEGIPADLQPFLRRAGGVSEFATQVADILQNPGPASAVAAAGLEEVARGHTWARHVAELEEIYEAAVSSAISDRRGR